MNIDETVLVEYVDYGNTETLSFTEIKKIPPMYLELPKQVNFPGNTDYSVIKISLTYCFILYLKRIRGANIIISCKKTTWI